MGSSLVEEILATAGTPVAGHTLSVQEMQRAIKEGRVLQINYWSTFGEGEASFSFATRLGLTSDGRVHPTYMVFPTSIPLPLRHDSDIEWEKIDQVFAAFGVSI